MAQVTKENIGLLNEKVTVRVEKEDYLPSFEKAIKSYSKTANIPGFRKGMVPTGMVKKMYGSSVFADEVIKSVEKSLQDYMANEKIEIFGQPLPMADNDASKLDMNQPSEYAFSFEIGLKPEITLPDLGSMHLTRYKVNVTDQMVDAEVDRILKENRNIQEADEVPAGDFEVSVALQETDGEGNNKEGGISRNYYFNSSDFKPEFRDQLTGKQKEAVLTLDPAANLEEKALETFHGELGFKEGEVPAGLLFRMTIERINTSTPAEMNEEFFKKLFPQEEVSSEAAFREEIRKVLEQQWEAPARNQLHDQIYHQLVDHTPIEFPESFLKRWLQTNENKPKTPEEAEAEYPGFVKSLQWTLIADKIMQDNNIHVHREEIEASAKQQLFGYFRGSMDLNPDQPWVNDYVQRMMNDKRFVEDTARRLEVEKVFGWIEGQVHPVETPISEEEFTRLQEQHQHQH